MAALPWQEQIVRDLFSTEGCVRKVREAYVSMPKKNGKSALCGAIALYALLTDSAPRIYGAASSRDQASIVFRAAVDTARALPAIQRKIRVAPSVRRIERADGAGFYQVLSADGDVQDGIEPTLAIVDELHRWRTAKAETLWSVLRAGMVAQREPLLLTITTAGAEHESSLWSREHERAQMYLSGALAHDAAYYARVWSADRKRVTDDPDYWLSREARAAANPSHEDHGGFLLDSVLAREAERARSDHAARQQYLRYHLNVPVMEQEDPVIDMPAWLECVGPVDVSRWERWDPERVIADLSLAGVPCYAGVDLSSTTDLTAVVLLFPPQGARDQYVSVPFFWMPRESVRELEERDRVPYTAWITRGFVAATPGRVVDYRAVRARLEWTRATFDLRHVVMDPWNSRQLSVELASDGFAVAELRQTITSLSPPTKKFLELYLSRSLWHLGHPVMTYCAQCLSLRADDNGNLRPDKPDRRKSAKRIDGIVALINALAMCMQPEDTRPTIIWI